MNEVLTILELPFDSFQINKKMQVSVVNQKLQDFKDLVKRQKKILSKKYHPDLSNGNEEKMKLINNMIDAVMAIEIRIMPVRRRVNVYYSYSTSTTTSSTSYTTSF